MMKPKGAVGLLLWLTLVTPSWAGALDLTLSAPITFAAYEGKKAMHVERFRDGTLYVGLQHQIGPGPFGFRSTDGGQTWAVAPYAGIMLGQAADGRILGFERSVARTGPSTFSGKVRVSRDGWATVQGPETVALSIPNATGGRGDDGIPFEGPLFWRSAILMPTRDLLATMYGYFVGDSAYRSLVVRSSDGGQSWTYLSTIAAEPVIGFGFAEPALVRLPNGQLLSLVRTGWQAPLYAVWSQDNGQTWTVPVLTGIDGVDPDLIVMQTGLVVVGYGVKSPRQRKLAVSLDQGRTWPHQTVIAAGAGGTYPGLREIRPGVILFVYEVQDGAQFHVRRVFVTVRR